MLGYPPLSARHEALLMGVPDIIAEVDANRVYTWMNPAGLEFFGPEALGQEAAHYFEGEQNTYELVEPVFCGERHLEYVIQEYTEHYHTERAHQGIGNEIIEPPPQGKDEVVCQERLGGLLNFYRRAA